MPRPSSRARLSWLGVGAADWEPSLRDLECPSRLTLVLGREEWGGGKEASFTKASYLNKWFHFHCHRNSDKIEKKFHATIDLYIFVNLALNPLNVWTAPKTEVAISPSCFPAPPSPHLRVPQPPPTEPGVGRASRVWDDAGLFSLRAQEEPES